MSLAPTAIDRAIRALSRENLIDLDNRRAQMGYDQLQEIEHQFQIAIEGTATPNLTWTDFAIPFDVEFFFAPQQRDSPLTVPHFTYGYVAMGDVNDPGDENNPHGLVGVFATVIRWVTDDREAIKGAKLGVGVVCGGPDVTTSIDFHGYLHVTFQGYGQVGGANGGENNPAAVAGT